MLFKKREEDREENQTYRILLNIIFGSVISLSTIVIVFILLVIIPLVYKINALSIFYFRSYNDVFMFIGFIISLIIIIFSFSYINTNVRKLSVVLLLSKDIHNETKKENGNEPDEELLKFLDEGEKRVYLLLIDSGGSLLQKDLVGLDDYSRATISRIIDRLEKKGIVEKIRHGSTNKIILKRVSK